MNSKEALHRIDSSCIFREVFNDEASTRRNGGIPTDVVFQDGKGVFNGSSSKMLYRKPLNGQYSIRIKLNITDVSRYQYVFDARTSGIGIGYIYFTSGNLTVSTGSEYINNEQTVSLINGDNEIIISGIFCTGVEFLIGINNTIVGYLGASIEFMEIYDRALTAEEVSLLYKQRYYRKSVLDNSNTKLLLDLDTRQGVLDVKTGVNTGIVLTPYDISFKKIGSNYSLSANGDTTAINCGTDFIGTKDVTVMGWFNIKSAGESNDGSIVNNGILTLRTGFNRFRLYSVPGTYAETSPFFPIYNRLLFLALTRTNLGIVNFYIGQKDISPTLNYTANQNSGTPVNGTSNMFIYNSSVFSRGADGLNPKLTLLEGIATLEEITNYWSSTKNMIG